MSSASCGWEGMQVGQEVRHLRHRRHDGELRTTGLCSGNRAPFDRVFLDEDRAGHRARPSRPSRPPRTSAALVAAILAVFGFSS